MNGQGAGSTLELPSGRQAILVRHSAAGVLIGVLILHPITMAIYWFEFAETTLPYREVWVIIFERIFLSFDPIMIVMMALFSIIGGSLGFGSGLYYRALRRKNGRLAIQERALQQTVHSHIEAGESSQLEFKSSMRWDRNHEKLNKSLEYAVVKTIAGFMNGKGGILLLGVDDSGTILGVEADYPSIKRSDRDGYQQHIMHLISTRLSANLCDQVDVRFHSIENKDVCMITILASNQPVYVRQGDLARYFLRTGNATRELNTQEAVNHILQRFNGQKSAVGPAGKHFPDVSS